MERNNQFGNYSNPEGQNNTSPLDKQNDSRYKFYMKYAQGFHLDGTPFPEVSLQNKKSSEFQKSPLTRYNSADNLQKVNQQTSVSPIPQQEIKIGQTNSNDYYREQFLHNYNKQNQTTTVVEQQVTTTRTVPQTAANNQTINRSISPQINRPVSYQPMGYQMPGQTVNYSNSQIANQSSLQRVKSNPNLISSQPWSSVNKIEERKLATYDKKREQNKKNYKYNLFSVLDQPLNGFCGADTGKCAGNECIASDGQRAEGWK